MVNHPKRSKKTAQVITAFKGFDLNLKCRDFQFEIGKAYKQAEPIVICQSGFHACKSPFDVLNYYSLVGSRFAAVELAGAFAEHDEDSKIASAEITVKAELCLPDFIRKAVTWLFDSISAAATTGDRSAAATTGDRSAAATTGNYSAAATTGDRSAAATTGDRSAAATTGNYSAAATTGYSSAAATTGYSSAAATTGNYSAAATTGYSSAAATTGYSSAAATTGDRSAAATTGDRSAAATTGYSSAAATTGYSSAAATTGDRSAAATTGYSSVAASLGYAGTAKAELGGAIMLAAYDLDYKLVAVFASKVGENGIEPGKAYQLGLDGKPVLAD